jgi:hypothetical protein
VQFHPTAIAIRTDGPLPLATEALRGDERQRAVGADRDRGRVELHELDVAQDRAGPGRQDEPWSCRPGPWCWRPGASAGSTARRPTRPARSGPVGLVVER